jgi:hypothetical protein
MSILTGIAHASNGIFSAAHYYPDRLFHKNTSGCEEYTFSWTETSLLRIGMTKDLYLHLTHRCNHMTCDR